MSECNTCGKALINCECFSQRKFKKGLSFFEQPSISTPSKVWVLETRIIELEKKVEKLEREINEIKMQSTKTKEQL